MKEWFTVENIELVAAQYRTLGPIIGLLLPFLEAFSKVAIYNWQ